MNKLICLALIGTILAFLFTACADVERRPDTVEEEPPGIVDRDGGGIDDNSAADEVESGWTDPAQSVLDVNWPDIPIMEGLTARTCDPVSDDTGRSGYIVFADGTVPLDEVIQFYRSLEGWEPVESDREGNDVAEQAVFDMVRDGELLNVAVSWDFGFTTLILTWVRDLVGIE